MRSLCITLLFLTSYANAESIHCTFTEPFITVSYNSDTNIVKIDSADTGNTELTGEVSFLKGGILRISMEGLSQYIDVNLNKEGSDGMSDFIYPFEAKFSETIIGGCETDTIKKTHPKWKMENGKWKMENGKVINHFKLMSKASYSPSSQRGLPFNKNEMTQKYPLSQCDRPSTYRQDLNLLA